MATEQLGGDCHTHSTFSDGLFSPAEMTPFYEAFEYDFRLQTDHLVVAVPAGRPAGKWLHAAQWPEYVAASRAATTPRHVCIPAAEVVWDAAAGTAADWFHTKFNPPPGKPFPDESFFAGVTWPEMLRKAKAAGFNPIVAHVDQGAPLDRLGGDEVCGLEVRGDIEETRPLLGRPSLVQWDRMLTAGRRVSLSGGSDAHQPDLWVGSALRTVLLDTPRDAAAISAAAVAGRSYLSQTWHLDCYAAAGWPEHPNPVVAGAVTHFWPWWEFKECPRLRGRAPRECVTEVFDVALKTGRCGRGDYPVLAAFTVSGVLSGQEAAAAGKSEVHAEWRMHVPVRLVRFVADGATVFQVSPAHPSFGAREGSVSATLDLRGKHYVRLEIEAADAADSTKRETLLANPVYLV